MIRRQQYQSSFTKHKLNNNGPNTETCGTQLLTSTINISDNTLLSVIEINLKAFLGHSVYTIKAQFVESIV